MNDYLVDAKGNKVEGLPLSYDNIDEQGNVLYLDEERLRRKEQSGKAMFKNHSNGLGIKNFLVTHLSARDWNWKLVLALFRKLLAWSAFMKQPDSMRSKLYKKGMYFSPAEKTYSTGTIYNLNVDADSDVKGTQAYKDAILAAGKTAGEGDTATCDAAAATRENAAAACEETAAACEEATARIAAPAHESAASLEHESGASNSTAHEPFQCKKEGKKAVIPVNKVVIDDARRITVPYDLVKKAIMESKYIGGMKECLCRAGGDCQNYPHDLACLFLNMGGKVVVDHGMAVELTKEEALARVDKAIEAGLTCQSLWVQVEQLIWGFRNDEMDAFLEVCFCCPCCCVGFNLSKNATRDVKRRFSPTGWTAVVNHDECIACGKCAEPYCPQEAIHFRHSDGKMVVDQENCVGCGMCKARCPQGAVKIKQTMPMRESMHDYFREEGRLEIVPGKQFE